MRNQNSNDIT